MDKKLIKQGIAELQEKLFEVNRLAREYNDAIDALQAICEHKWEYTGHGHNDSGYKCSICSREEWR